MLFVRKLVQALEMPAGKIQFLQVAPGEFLFTSIKVAGYGGLTLSLPFILFQFLKFILPGLTKKEKLLIAPSVAGSAILFFLGIFFAWKALIPAALGFLINYGADVVEPLWSIEKYLDFVQGIAVNSLGHAHPKLVNAVNKQSKKLWHVSNAFQIPEGEVLAKKLAKKTFADYVMFQNSGAEATEGAIKAARRYFY